MELAFGKGPSLGTVAFPRYSGTRYRAANWICVGQTQGRGRMDRTHPAHATHKDILLFALARQWRKRHCQISPPQPCRKALGDLR